MLPILGRLGPLTFYTYTVLIDLGLGLALAWLAWRAPAGRTARWLDAGLVSAVGAFVGARLVFVIAHGEWYGRHLAEVFALWQGGLSWPGAAAGGLLALALYSRRRREPLGPVLDALALPIAALGLLGWTGCAAAGCAYGFEVAPGTWPGLLTWQAPDLYGLVAPRLATQPLGMVWSLIALAALARPALAAAVKAPGTARAWSCGAAGLLALSQVALGAFLLSLTRGDPAPLAAGFRLDTLGSALVLVGASLAWAWRVSRPAAPPAAPLPEQVPS